MAAVVSVDANPSEVDDLECPIDLLRKFLARALVTMMVAVETGPRESSCGWSHLLPEEVPQFTYAAELRLWSSSRAHIRPALHLSFCQVSG
jgi:hypothetical protein